MAGAIPTRDSISSGIGVDRHTSVFQTEIERALLSCPSTFPSESGPPAETPHGRSCARPTAGCRIQCAWDSFSRREHRCRSGLHRPDCGGSTPPSRSRSLRMATRVANFESEVPALNPREVLAHGHQVRFRGNPPFQDHGEMTIILRFERSVILRFGGVRKRSSRPAREMPAMGRRTIQCRRSNESGRR